MNRAGIFAVAVLATAGSLQAGVIGTSQTLSALLQSGDSDPGIQVGDKLFHNFAYNFTGDMPTAGLVNVIPITDVFGNFGLRFHGAFQDKAGGGASDALITYTVDVLDPSMQISAAHIAGDTRVFGTGSATVTETWLPDAGDAAIGIFDIRPGTTSLLDSIDFSPVTFGSLRVQKDILIDAGPSTIGDEPNYSTANVTFIDQTYSQVEGEGGGAETPEPASLGMLAVGSAALLMRRRAKA